MSMEEHQTMVDDCMKRDSRLDEWEHAFIDSIYHRLGDGKSLTDKQAETLDRIWEKVTEDG